MPKHLPAWTKTFFIICLSLALVSCSAEKPATVNQTDTATKIDQAQTEPSLDRKVIHPLDPLTTSEFNESVIILRKSLKFRENGHIPVIELIEPTKDQVLQFKPGDQIDRNVLAVVYVEEQNKTFEARINLNKKSLTSFKEMPGVQPRLMHSDGETLKDVLTADPGFNAALNKRGLKFDDIHVDSLPSGSFGLPTENGDRILRVIAYNSAGKMNMFSRPIEGLAALVDLTTKKVIKLTDNGVVPFAQPAEFDATAIGAARHTLKPLQIANPEGQNFTVKGQEITWDNWRFRFSVHQREGLVLHMVEYLDHGKYRPVLYRAGVSEIVTPYGDTSETWFFRSVFDAGEYSLNCSALDPRECPPNASFFPAAFANDRGLTHEVHRAVAIYERDSGLLWRHANSKLKRKELRRARELVVSTTSTVGSYDFVFNWIFHQDGSIEQETLLTGVMLTKGVQRKSDLDHSHADSHGHLVASNLEAVHHQHFFCFRLDLDVDGQQNVLVESNTSGMPAGKDNPYLNGIIMKETTFSTEKEAQRDLNMQTSRRWKMINPAKLNALGQPVGYVLLAGENSFPFAAPTSSVRKRAAFINHHIWCTPYSPDEMFAAGYYPNQSKGPEGLAKWTGANRSIQNKDLVLWYTMGITHLPRPEEWPVMPAYKCGFKLLPSSFFDKNPALDLPAPPKDTPAPAASNEGTSAP